MRTVTLDQIRVALDARGLLPASAWHRTKFDARCPCHDDRNPSLTVTEQPDGTVTLHCHAGCTDGVGWEPVLQELGLWQLLRRRLLTTESTEEGRRGGVRPSSVVTDRNGAVASVVSGPRALAAARGRPNITPTEYQRWRDLLEHWQGRLVPVPVVVAVPTRAGPKLRQLAESIVLLVGLRAARGGYGIHDPFTFTRANPTNDGEVGFGEAWSLLSSVEVGNGLHALKRHGSLEKLNDPPPSTDPKLLDRERRGWRTPPNFWRIVPASEGPTPLLGNATRPGCASAGGRLAVNRNGHKPPARPEALGGSDPHGDELVAAIIDLFDAEEIAADDRAPLSSLATDCGRSSHVGWEWRLTPGGLWTCSICHPPAVPGIEVEWNARGGVG